MGHLLSRVLYEEIATKDRKGKTRTKYIAHLESIILFYFSFAHH